MASSLSSNLNHLINLAKWLPHAKTLDTVDSPYLVEFIKEVVKTPLEHSTKAGEIEQIREQLLSDLPKIKDIDFGSGATIHQDQRTISQKAKSSLPTTSKYNLLARLGRYYQPSAILELGSQFGISTYYLSAACPTASITSIDINPAYQDISNSNKPDWADNIEFKEGKFDVELKKIIDQNKKYDLILIDGSLSVDIQQQLWPLHKALAHENTVFILDDIYQSGIMKSWWSKIKENQAFNLALDLYHFGILKNETAIKESIDVKLFPKNWRWQLGVKR